MSLQLRIHYTPGEFLDTASAFLEQQELNNNLLLGLTAALNHTEHYPQFHFLSVAGADNKVVAASAKIGYKAILASGQMPAEAISLLASYYRQHCAELPGIFAESSTAEAFISHSEYKVKTVNEMIVHRMETILPAHQGADSMEIAALPDLELLTKYLSDFDVEIFGSNIKTTDILRSETENRIRRNEIYTWKNEAGNTVSMAITVRFTRHIAVIGYVYTPAEYRGKGYAGSLVWTLSKMLLDKGYQCALFTEKLNPVSNGIYKKIGYIPGAVFSDISF